MLVLSRFTVTLVITERITHDQTCICTAASIWHRSVYKIASVATAR